MNIIIDGFHDESQFKAIYRICSHYKAKYVATVFSKSAYPLPPVIEADYFEHEEVTYKGDYGIPEEDLLPLDGKLLEQMATCEEIALNMMNRLEVYKSYSYPERRKLFQKHLRVWNHIIETHNIDLFIGSNIPHIPYSFVAYELCRLRKIPTIIMKQSQVRDCYLVYNDWDDPVSEIREYYKNNLKNKISLSKKFQDHFESHVGNKDTTPYYMKPRKGKFKQWIDSVVTEKRFLRRFHYGIRYLASSLYSRYRSGILNRYYNSLCQAPDYNEKYIYFPLHLQPEMTTSPSGGVFVDQDIAIKLLAKALPDDYHIYVKENPKQTHISRDKGYYKSINSLKNVRLIPKDVDTYKLIANTQATATITGTAGWESLLRGKPVLIFGYEFYQWAPGTVKIKTLGDAKRAIDFIKDKKNWPTKKKMKAFVKALEQVSRDGYVNPPRRAISNMSDEDNEQSLYESISGKIKQIK